MIQEVVHGQKPIVIAVGLFLPGTGFTRVFESLFAELSACYDIHWMGIGYRGEVISTDHYSLYPVNKNGGDIYGAYGAASMASLLGAKTIFLLNDFFMLKNYRHAWLPLKERGIKLVAYVPLDGYFNNTLLIPHAFLLDDLVLYSDWAKAELEKNIRLHRQETGTEAATQLHCIFHGVDTGIFKKDEGSAKHIFGDRYPADAVFLLNANRNAERKDIQTTLSAFQKALPHFSKPAYLCLHMPKSEAIQAADIQKYIEELGIADHVICNPLGNDYVSNESLAALYRSCDIGINTSYGEGWGLISFEHAACGGAQIVPDNTTPGELWAEAGIRIPRKESVQLPSNPFRMYSTDADALAEQLILLVNDDAKLQEVKAACHALAHDKKFDWSLIAEQWKRIL